MLDLPKSTSEPDKSNEKKSASYNADHLLGIAAAGQKLSKPNLVSQKPTEEQAALIAAGIRLHDLKFTTKRPRSTTPF